MLKTLGVCLKWKGNLGGKLKFPSPLFFPYSLANGAIRLSRRYRTELAARRWPLLPPSLSLSPGLFFASNIMLSKGLNLNLIFLLSFLVNPALRHRTVAASPGGRRRYNVRDPVPLFANKVGPIHNPRYPFHFLFLSFARNSTCQWILLVLDSGQRCFGFMEILLARWYDSDSC